MVHPLATPTKMIAVCAPAIRMLVVRYGHVRKHDVLIEDMEIHEVVALETRLTRDGCIDRQPQIIVEGVLFALDDAQLAWSDNTVVQVVVAPWPRDLDQTALADLLHMLKQASLGLERLSAVLDN
jgi:hypothetical protein